MALPPLNAPSPAQLLTLGMFVFGMDTLAYSELQRTMAWRHAASERHMARPASQYTGPGEEKITLSGRVVPEFAGSYSAIDTLIDMADSGEDWPLMDGLGRVLGNFRILRLDQSHVRVMAGGIPRQVDFTIELERAD